MAAITKDKISISKTEYARLKKVDAYFRHFWEYMKNLIEIQEARKEIKNSEVISQEKLFKQLGF